MSVAWTPIRLSMSASSSQTSTLSEHVNALRTTNKLAATPTVAYRSSNYYSEDYLRRQETVLEKQTVRITPPSHADGPKSTVIIEKRRVNGNGNVRSSNGCCSPKSSSVFDEHYYLDRSASNSRAVVDKECQTDEVYEFRRTTSSKSTNMDDCGEYSSNDFISDANLHVRSACDEVDNYSNKTSDLLYSGNNRETDRTESKDREIEHIDVIVNESRYTPDTTDEEILDLDPAGLDDIIAEKHEETNPDVESEAVKLNGYLAESEIEVQSSESSKLKDDKHLEEEEDEDSCCVNCLYVSMNICDCVIV